MAYVLTQSQLMATAAADVAAIGTTVNEATAAAAGRTTGVVAAAADEVSTAVAILFGAYAQQWQLLIARAAVFHSEFTQTLAAAGNASSLQAANTQIVDATTTAVSTAYSTLLPTADIATAVLVSLPSYDVNLFLNGMIQVVNGQPLEGLINAVGYPIATDAGLLPLTAGLEVAVLGEAAYSIITGTPYGSF